MLQIKTDATSCCTHKQAVAGTSHCLLLGVNIDYVAFIREARGTCYPEPIHAALIAEQAGADAITVHLRSDRRHIQERDVILLRQILQTRLNLELAVTPDAKGIAIHVKPHDCCLVPERSGESTTESGLDVKSQIPFLKKYCTDLIDAGIRVAVFVDPDVTQIEAAREIGANTIELNTGRYADAKTPSARAIALEKLHTAVNYATTLGLQVNAGHGLDYHNVQSIVGIAGLTELNIGHAIMARAMLIGLDQAVRDMKQLLALSWL